MVSLSAKNESRYPKAIVAFGLLAMFISVPTFSQSPKTTHRQDTVSEGIVYTTGDYDNRPSEFPGGVSAMFKWLGDSITYPDSTVEWSGKIVVEFDISEDGEVINPRIIKHGWDVLEKEILKMVVKMPGWIPAKRNGKPIKSSYTLPITFKLSEEETSDQ